MTNPNPTLRRRSVVGLGLATATLLGSLVVRPLPAQAAGATLPVTSRVSVSDDVAQGSFGISGPVLLDQTGRFSFFTSDDPLDPADTNQYRDVYVHDQLSGHTRLVSLTDADQPVTGVSDLCGASRDGRYVGFRSYGLNLQGAGSPQLYLRDRKEGRTGLVSVSSSEVAANSDYGEGACPISDDGRYVAFDTDSDNLVSGDQNGKVDVFRRDRLLGTTSRVSLRADGAELPAGGRDPAMSADGSVVAFVTSGTAVLADMNGLDDVYVRVAGTTEQVSLGDIGQQLNGASSEPDLSADGLSVAFQTDATNTQNIVPDGNGGPDVYVRQRQVQTTSLVSRSSAGARADASSGFPAFSPDGRYVGFSSIASNLATDDVAGTPDSFAFDRQTGQTALVSRNASGVRGNGASWTPALSADGTVAAFRSSATNLVTGDTNGTQDAFTRDATFDLSPFATLDAFLDANAQDFLGRAPTTTERTNWLAAIRNGEASLEQGIDYLAHTPEWAGYRAPVIRLYWAFFLRKPDLAGLDHWVARRKAGKSLAWVASQFAASAEFKANYGNLGNAGFVTLVYNDVLGRDPDGAGLAYWTKQLDQKLQTRGDVMTGFSESAEAKRLLAPQVDAVLVRLGMLHAMPSQATFAADVALQQGGEPLEAVIRQVLASAPYEARFQ